MSGSNRSFFLGAGAMLAGVVAGNLLRVSTLDNLRKIAYLADEARDIYKGTKPRPVPVPEEGYEDNDSLQTPDYDPMFDRESMPPPPPASYDNFKAPVPVSISFDDDDQDFLTKINEDAAKGDSLISDWTQV
jgi:hypothetical protein